MLKNKSFLVKLLTLICVICCSFALMLGAVSCAEGPVGPAGPQGEQGPAGEDGKDGDDGKDGEDGQDGEDGRGITKTEINDEGELEITYSDGTVVNLGVVVGESAPECDHDFFEYEAVKHYMEDGEVVNGVIIKVCKKNCGTAHYEVGALHNYEETVVAPKCTEQGYTAAVCTVCGDAVDPHDFTDPTGHKDFDPTNTEDWYPVVEAGKTICEDGGAVVYVCEDCDATVAAVVEATGHHSTAWSKVSGQHKLTGSCYICGNNVTVDVPELNQANVTAGKLTYEVTSEKENCGDTGVGTYTYVIDGQTFTYEKDIPATGHILDKGEGVEINDSMMPLDYDTYKDDVTFFADEELTCDASAATPAYFECKECGESVLVSVRKAHTEPTGGDEVEITAGEVAAKLAAITNADKNVYVVPATCTVAGSRTFYCSACEEAVTVAVPELGHKKAYTLKEVGDKVYLVTYCANCDKLAAAGAQTCGFAQTEEEIENYRVIESVADTCEAAGYKVIGYTPVGATEEITLKIEGTKLNHKINNTRPAIDKPFDYNVWKDYVTLFADKALTCADGGVQAYFKCEDCDASVLISVKVPHTAPTKTEEVTGVTSDAIKADLELATPVTYAKDTVYVLNATCEADGFRVYFCDVCDQVIVETKADDDALEALGHDYKYTYNSVSGELEGVCANDDSHLNNIAPDTDTLESEVIKKPTCTEEGIKRWTYKVGGVPGYTDEAIAKAPHTLADGTPADKAYYDPDTEGVEVFVNTSTACSGTGAAGYFECKVCGGSVLITVKDDHTKPTVVQTVDARPATLEANILYVKAATCDDIGYEWFKCTVCGVDQEEEIEALGHTYKFTVATKPSADATGSITVSCEDCTTATLAPVNLPELDTADAYSVKTLAEKTCKTAGLKEYTYKFDYDGSTNKAYSVTFTVDEGKAAHTYDTELYYWTLTVGEGDAAVQTVYEGKLCTVCGQMEVVQKWVVGDDHEDDEHTLGTVEYTWVEIAEDGVTTTYYTGKLCGDKMIIVDTEVVPPVEEAPEEAPQA